MITQIVARTKRVIAARQKIVVIADINIHGGIAPRIDTYLDDDPYDGCGNDVLLSARNQSTLAVIVPRYCTVARAFRSAERSVLSEAVENHAENGSCTCRREQGRPLARSRRGRRSGTSRRKRDSWRDRLPDKDQRGVCLSSSARRRVRKEVSIRRAGLNNSDKGPSLAPLTRERNLLAPARCALPAALFSSFTWSSLTRGHNGLVLGSLFLLPHRWGKSIDH